MSAEPLPPADAVYPRAFAEGYGQVTGGRASEPTLVGTSGSMPSRFPVEDAAAATVATALTTAARWKAFGGGRPAEVGLHRDHVASAFRSEAFVRLDGELIGSGFAPLSRFWPTADGWVRTHANYEWHRRALLRVLGIADGAGDPAAVGAAIATWRAAELEQQVMAAGGITVAVRPEEEWAGVGPLVDHRLIGNAPARRGGSFRVLDLTRVIAGPVGTRFLAAVGGDVLRVDPPQLPEQPAHVIDGFVSKRSTLIDARTAEGSASLHRLIDEADVLVHGYRPGALAAFGFQPESLSERHPGLVVVALSAWGDQGLRGRQRGFDSIVQAASGIAMISSADDGRPGALPCQLLDHGTGYLVAAAALDGLLRQRSEGGTRIRTLSLAATASWLLSLPRTDTVAPATVVDPTPWVSTIGRLTAVKPPGTLDGVALSWPRGLPDYGGDPAWW